MKNIEVASKLSHGGLEFSFRRNPRGGMEQAQFERLKEMVEDVTLSNSNDRWSWSLVGSGDFLVSSVRKLIDNAILPKGISKTRWIKEAPGETETCLRRHMLYSLVVYLESAQLKDIWSRRSFNGECLWRSGLSFFLMDSFSMVSSKFTWYRKGILEDPNNPFFRVVRFVLTFISTSWRHPWDPVPRIVSRRMSAMENTTPLVTTVTKPATNPRDTDTTPRVNIQEFCEEYYEDILPIIMDKVRQDRRKDVHTRLDFGEGPRERAREDSHHSSARARTTKPERVRVQDRLRYDNRRVLDHLGHRRQSAFDRLSETYSPSTTKSHPQEADFRDTLRGKNITHGLNTSREDHLKNRERFRSIRESYDDSFSHSCRDGNHSRHRKRRRDNESPLSSVSRSDSSDGGYRRTRMPNNVKTYDGTGDPKDHVKVLNAAAHVERWAMPTWCHMFNSTLIVAAIVWFDELPPESIDSYKDLKAAFLAYFMQQKKYVKDPVKIHNIKQRDGEIIKDFMEHFKVETRRMKGTPECLRISGFMHGVNNPELKKRLNEHPPPMVTPVEKRTSNKFCDFHNNKGHNTDECMQLKKQIEELVRAGKLLHLIKEIKQGRDQSKTGKKETAVKDKLAAIYMVQLWQRTVRQKVTQSFERVKEIVFPPLRPSQMVPTTTSLTGFSGETIWLLGQLRLLVIIGDATHSTRAWMNFMIVKSLSPYNSIIERPGLRAIQAVSSIVHGMLKFPIEGGIVTIRNTILIPNKCTLVITSSMVPNKERIRPANFKVALHPDFPDQEVAIGGTLSDKGRTELCSILKKNLNIFAWKPSNMTGVSRSVAEQRLNILEGYLPVRQNKRGQAPERAKAIQAEVQKLVEARIMREVYYYDWLSNPVMVKKHDGSWRMCVDFTDLNKAYTVAEPDEEKTTFHTWQWVYCYTKMPFGLKNAGATYQRLMDNAFEGQISQNIEVYADDLVVKSYTEAEMTRDIEETFRTLRKVNMKLNPKKCSFGLEEGVFLGYVVTPEGIKPCPDKTAVVLQLPSPRIIKECGPDDQKRNDPNANLLYKPRVTGSGTKLLSDGKLVLSLVFAAKRLRRYLQAHPITVITDQPIKQVMSRPDVAGWLQKWSIMLGEHNTTYRPRTLVKGQILADFLIAMPGEDPQAAPAAETQKESWKLFTDGSSCVDGSGARLILTSLEGVEFTYALRFQFTASNNEAEYEALIAGMRIAAGEKAPPQGPTIRVNGGDPLQTVVPYAMVKMRRTAPGGPLTPIMAPLPFYKWGIDIAGPFPEGPRKVKFLIVAMDYFTKWIEAKAMATITGGQIGMPTYRTAAVDVVRNGEELRLNLDLLEEHREHAVICEAKAKSRMTKYYNARVRDVTFKPSGFVYCSNDASHAVAGGKLGPKWEGPYEVTEALGNGAYKLRSMDGTILPRTWNIANLKRCYL
uniref:Reverse transcriptase domain-containing protein n=1 Tax=Tanacetum cinerariifolium TaxID=118510 RepID=A0A6L2JP86_TANCI|nr:reverse transcriptase domain-containing protein [Tanacetum cinerariifolium]